MDFPRMVHKADGRLVVASQEAFDQALADGWVASRADIGKEPEPAEPEPVDSPVDVPKKRGRPRKG